MRHVSSVASRNARRAVPMALAMMLFAQAGTSQATDCTPAWLPTFGCEQGVDGAVYSLAVHDDGSGPALYAGGKFATAGGVTANNVARWDGSRWSALGSGIGPPDLNSTVYSLAVFDDGSGPALYAGGYFHEAGGIPAMHIARWNGSAWSALAGGLGGSSFIDVVLTLASHDDGSGPALYAGGYFGLAGGVTVSNIARWDGSSWSALGTGSTSGGVNALEVFDDGGGPALHAGGSFTSVGGVAANRVAKWDGTAWSPLGSGVDADDHMPGVSTLTTFDDGSGSALFVGGLFTSAGGMAANHAAKWDGVNWTPVGSGLAGGTPTSIGVLMAYDDGTGPALHAGGSFTSASGVEANHIAKWDGSGWTALGSGLNDRPYDLAVFDGGSGPKLCAGGWFSAAGDQEARQVAAWDGAGWSALGSGLDRTVAAASIFDAGGGPALHVTGEFTKAGSTPLGGVARWDGTTWQPLGSGLDGSYAGGGCLEVFDDGSGPGLYVAGRFTTAGGIAANNVAVWDGSSWTPLGSGVSGLDELSTTVHDMAVFDDGGGPALYVAGQFTTAGGLDVKNIAKWNGSTWAKIAGMNKEIYVLEVFDDGSGPALFAGGRFTTAGQHVVSFIAKWHGAGWSALAGGLGGHVQALSVFDDGTGPALYAGGNFTYADGSVPANGIARWDGSTWTALGDGLGGNVYALAAFEDAGRPALFVGGAFSTAGGLPAKSIAKWSGTVWSALGSSGGPVYSLGSFDAGDGPALYVGGGFEVSPAGDSYMARWGCPPAPSSWTDLGSGLAGIVGLPELSGTGTLDAGSPGVLTLAQSAAFAPAALLASVTSTPVAFKGGTLVPSPVAVALVLLTDGSGAIPLEWTTWPSGIPTGTRIYVQYAIQDAAAVQGVSLSNALLAETP